MRRTLLPLVAVLLTGCGVLTSAGDDPGPTRSQDRDIPAVSQVQLKLGLAGAESRGQDSTAGIALAGRIGSIVLAQGQRTVRLDGVGVELKTRLAAH